MVDNGSSIDHINYISDDRSKDFDRIFFQSVFLGDEGTQDDDDIADFDKFCGVEDLQQTNSTRQDFLTIIPRQQLKKDRHDVTDDHWRPSKVRPPTFQPLLSSAHDSASRTLEELLDELISPQTATSETNDICSAILRHPDLSKKPSGLNVFSKMNGGLKNYVPGTAQAWLYVPRKRAYTTNTTEQPSILSRLALIFVYPDECGPSGQYEDPKTKLHFGGRAHEINNGTVFLQHGSYKFLGIKARKFQLIEKRPPCPAANSDLRTDSQPTTKRSLVEGPVSSSDVNCLPVPQHAPPSIDKRSQAFDDEVEEVRKKLKCNDLKSINAILTEVWAREVVAAGTTL